MSCAIGFGYRSPKRTVARYRRLPDGKPAANRRIDRPDSAVAADCLVRRRYPAPAPHCILFSGQSLPGLWPTRAQGKDEYLRRAIIGTGVPIGMDIAMSTDSDPDPEVSRDQLQFPNRDVALNSVRVTRLPP